MDRKQKIVLFTTHLGMGGVQMKIISIARELNKQKFEVHVIYNGHGVLSEELDNIPGIEIHTIRSLQRNPHPIKDSLSIVSLIAYFHSRSPDIVSYAGPKAALLGSIAAWFARVPFRIYFLSGIQFNERQRLPIRLAFQGLEKLTCAFSSVVVCVSQLNREKLLLSGITRAEKLETIYSGYDLQRFLKAGQENRQDLRKALGWHPNHFIVLQVSNLEPVKNVLDLLRAAKHLAPHYPFCRFYIVGEGSDRIRLEQHILSERLENHCFLLGWRRDVPELMTASDVVTLTSRKEGLPQVCSQAMATGTPLVMYDCEGIREELHHNVNGLLVRNGDVNELTQAIEELILSPDKRRQFGEQGLRMLNWDHDIDKMMARLETFYSSLDRKTGGRSRWKRCKAEADDERR